LKLEGSTRAFANDAKNNTTKEAAACTRQATTIVIVEVVHCGFAFALKLCPVPLSHVLCCPLSAFLTCSMCNATALHQLQYSSHNSKTQHLKKIVKQTPEMRQTII
jgi:hypothetical protein